MKTRFGSRLLAAGEQLLYEPGAIVHHPVTADRLQKDYFLRWWLEKGRFDIRAAATPPLSTVASMGTILRRLPHWATWTLKWLFTFEMTTVPKQDVVWMKLGEMAEVISPSRNHKAVPTQL
jgi:hypothetical protein